MKQDDESAVVLAVRYMASDIRTRNAVRVSSARRDGNDGIRTSAGFLERYRVVRSVNACLGFSLLVRQRH